MIDNNSELVTTRVAAKQVNLSHDYIARLAREGRIKAEQRGRSWYVDIVSLLRWFESNRLEKEYRAALIKEEREAEKTCVALRDQEMAVGWLDRLQVGIAMQALAYVCVAVGVGVAGLYSVNSSTSMVALFVDGTQQLAQLERTAVGTSAALVQDDIVDLDILSISERERVAVEYVNSWFRQPVLVVWNDDGFRGGVLVLDSVDRSDVTPFSLGTHTRPERE